MCCDFSASLNKTHRGDILLNSFKNRKTKTLQKKTTLLSFRFLFLTFHYHLWILGRRFPGNSHWSSQTKIKSPISHDSAEKQTAKRWFIQNRKILRYSPADFPRIFSLLQTLGTARLSLAFLEALMIQLCIAKGAANAGHVQFLAVQRYKLRFDDLVAAATDEAEENKNERRKEMWSKECDERGEENK